MLTLKLAWRNLFRNVRRTILTCLMLASSLAVLIIVDGIMISVTEMMVSSITHTLAGEAQVHRKGFLENLDVELYIEEPQDIIKTLEADDTVAAVAPRTMVGAMVASSHNTSGGIVYGVDAARELGVSRIKDAIVEGKYLSGNKREILIGKPLADILEVELGDRIVVTAATVDTNEISQELFKLSGIFEFGPSELDEGVLFINFDTAQNLFGMQGKAHEVAVRFIDPDYGKQRDHPVLQKLNMDQDIAAETWLDFNSAMGAIIEMSGLSTLILGTVLFLLASFGVINSMFMSIYERIYEFGVVRAIGTKSTQLIQLVLCEAFLLAVLACIAGNILGLLGSGLIQEYGIPMDEVESSGIVIGGHIHSQIVFSQFIEFPIYVTLLTLAAAVYPAIFAARLVPSDALHRSL